MGQPDLYVIDIEGSPKPPTETPNAVLVYPREDQILVLNGMEGSWSVFANSFGSNLGLSTDALLKKSLRLCSGTNLEQLPLPFAVLYDVRKSNITVLKINDQNPAPGAHITFSLANGAYRVEMHFSAKVQELVYGTRVSPSMAFHDCNLYDESSVPMVKR